MNVRAIVLLEDEPRFRPFPFALPNTPALASSIRNAERLLSRSPGRFDGPIAFCHGVSPDGAVLRRSGRYAEAMVVFEEPTLAYKLGFALGVQLFVEREEGVVLFQLRAASIGRDPLLWTASASGGLMPREEPRTAVLADAAEEVAFREDDLEGFRPVALCLNDDSGSALVVYHARLRSGAEPVPDETKVAELHWAASPSEIGAQVSGDTVACWAALERWRESLREGAATLGRFFGIGVAGDLVPPGRLPVLQLALDLLDVRGELALLVSELLLQVRQLGLAPLELVLADLGVRLDARLALLDAHLAVVELAHPVADCLLHLGETLLLALEALLRRVGELLRVRELGILLGQLAFSLLEALLVLVEVASTDTFGLDAAKMRLAPAEIGLARGELELAGLELLQPSDGIFGRLALA